MHGHRQDPNSYPHHPEPTSSYHAAPHHHPPAPEVNSSSHHRAEVDSPYPPPEQPSPYYPRQEPPPSSYPHLQDSAPYHHLHLPPHPQDQSSAYSRRQDPPPAQHWAPPPPHHQGLPGGAPLPPLPQANGYGPPPPSGQTNGYHPSHAGGPPTSLPPLIDHRADMAMHAPPPHYRLPVVHDYYNRGPPHPDYRGSPHMYAQPPQPAPRQRTAIACRYCRRRKIRCSGFESEDGRCTNCARFSQECVFTPVASQAQAFVPAHALYGRGGGTANGDVRFYGAYGQPVRPEDVNYPSRPGPQYPPPPPHAYGHGHAPPPPYSYDAPPAQNGVAGRRRPASDALPPRPRPPMPATTSNLPRTLAPELNHHDYRYPDPATAGGPPRSPPATGPYLPAPHMATPHTAHAPTSQQAHPYYHSQPSPPHRVSPTGTSYATDASRASASPNTLATSSTPGTEYLNGAPPGYPSSDHHAAINSNLAVKEYAELRPESRSPAGKFPVALPPAPSTAGTSPSLAPLGTHTPVPANGGQNTPPGHTTTSGQHSPTNGQTGERPGLSIRSIVTGDAPNSGSSIDSAMLARLGNP